MSNYTKKQMEYIDSVDGQAHMSAVKIIGDLEKELAKHEWVSVEDRLPTARKLYLIKGPRVLRAVILNRSYANNLAGKWLPISHWKPITFPEKEQD